MSTGRTYTLNKSTAPKATGQGANEKSPHTKARVNMIRTLFPNSPGGMISIEIARVEKTSSASPQMFFERWCDLPSHPEWAPSMEYFILEGEFSVGATGRSKPVDGPESTFTVTEIGPGYVYADATDLGGAILTVRHEAVTTGETTQVTLTGLLDGPQALQTRAHIAQDLQEALEEDLDSLITLLEQNI